MSEKTTAVFLREEHFSPIDINILLVEDSPTDADLITRMLKQYNGFIQLHIHHVETLAEAIEALEHCDAVVLDLNLPDSSGLNTAIEVRKKTMKPLIVWSANLDGERTLACGMVGVDSCFEKVAEGDGGLPGALTCFVGKTCERVRQRRRTIARLRGEERGPYGIPVR